MKVPKGFPVLTLQLIKIRLGIFELLHSIGFGLVHLLTKGGQLGIQVDIDLGCPIGVILQLGHLGFLIIDLAIKELNDLLIFLHFLTIGS